MCIRDRIKTDPIDQVTIAIIIIEAEIEVLALDMIQIEETIHL